MEIMLVFLSTAIGTVAGVIVAVVMMQRKIRVAGTGNDIALKTQLQNTEWALASAGRDVEDLRRQLDNRDQAAQQGREELQQQLMAAIANTEKEAAAKAEAQQRIAELEAQAAALSEQVAKAAETAPAAAEAERKVAAFEADLADSRRQVEDLTARLAALTVQHAGDKRAAEEEAVRQAASLETALTDGRRLADDLAAQLAAVTEQKSALETALTESRRQVEELNTRIAALSANHTDQQRACEELAGRQINALETEIANGRRLIDDLTGQLAEHKKAAEESFARFAAQIAELTDERATLEAELRKERETAAEGMELLMLAQSKLLGTPRSGNGSGNGNGNGAVHMPETVDIGPAS